MSLKLNVLAGQFSVVDEYTLVYFQSSVLYVYVELIKNEVLVFTSMLSFLCFYTTIELNRGYK